MNHRIVRQKKQAIDKISSSSSMRVLFYLYIPQCQIWDHISPSKLISSVRHRKPIKIVSDSFHASHVSSRTNQLMVIPTITLNVGLCFDSVGRHDTIFRLELFCY